MRATRIEWPTDFRECGPQADPTILLNADAKIAETKYLVTAVRMNSDLTEPDYRGDIDEAIYDPVMDEIRDGLEFVMCSMDPELLPLADGLYLLWMVPANLS